MATEADHFAAIVAEPEDDGPRVIYADWLDENGDSDRAEFIRVQCKLARSIGEPGGPADFSERQRLLERQKALLAEHASTWLGPLVNTVLSEQQVRYGLLNNTLFKRGFPTLVINNMFSEAIEHIPLCSSLLIDNVDGPLMQVIGRHSEALDKICGDLTINCNGAIAGHDLTCLSGLRCLRSLSLANSEIPADGFSSLANLKHLTFLDLQSSKITDDGLKHLLNLTELRLLCLAHTAIHGEGLRHISQLPHLDALYLYTNRENMNVFSEILAQKGFSALSFLEVDGSCLPDKTMLQIAKCPKIQEVKAFGYHPSDDQIKRLRELGMYTKDGGTFNRLQKHTNRQPVTSAGQGNNPPVPQHHEDASSTPWRDRMARETPPAMPGEPGRGV